MGFSFKRAFTVPARLKQAFLPPAPLRDFEREKLGGVLTKSVRVAETVVAGAVPGVLLGGPLGLVTGAAGGLAKGIDAVVNNKRVDVAVQQAAVIGTIAGGVTASSALKSAEITKNAASASKLYAGAGGSGAYTPTFGSQLSTQLGIFSSEVTGVAGYAKDKVIGGLSSTAGKLTTGALAAPAAQFVKDLFTKKPGAPPSGSQEPSYSNQTIVQGGGGANLDNFLSGLGTGLGNLLTGLGVGQSNLPGSGGIGTPTFGAARGVPGNPYGDLSSGEVSGGYLDKLLPSSSDSGSSPILASLGGTGGIALFLFIGVAVFFIFGGKKK